MSNYTHNAKKLTTEAVMDMRTNYKKRVKGSTVPDFAVKYKVSKQTVISVLKNETWTHVKGPTPEQKLAEAAGVTLVQPMVMPKGATA